MHHSAERYVAQVRWCAVIADDAVGQHGEGMGIVSKKHPRSLHADAAAAVGMIHEHQFASIRERLFQRGKLPRLWPERLICQRYRRYARRDDEAQYKTIF